MLAAQSLTWQHPYDAVFATFHRLLNCVQLSSRSVLTWSSLVTSVSCTATSASKSSSASCSSFETAPVGRPCTPSAALGLLADGGPAACGVGVVAFNALRDLRWPVYMLPEEVPAAFGGGIDWDLGAATVGKRGGGKLNIIRVSVVLCAVRGEGRLDACTAPDSGSSLGARAAWLACVGGLAFLICVFAFGISCSSF